PIPARQKEEEASHGGTLLADRALDGHGLVKKCSGPFDEGGDVSLSRSREGPVLVRHAHGLPNKQTSDDERQGAENQDRFHGLLLLGCGLASSLTGSFKEGLESPGVDE